MKEQERIIKLFEDLYNGSPWIDVNLYDTLKGISAEDAATKRIKKGNSIWEIVNHLISWRLNVLERIQGEIINSPSDNYFKTVINPSEDEWQNTLNELDRSQSIWIKHLKKFNQKNFTTTYPINNLTFYEHIMGILQHDAYHLGQIKMLVQ
jgi:uncharacterized damage-inducible protein DinB